MTTSDWFQLALILIGAALSTWALARTRKPGFGVAPDDPQILQFNVAHTWWEINGTTVVLVAALVAGQAAAVIGLVWD